MQRSDNKNAKQVLRSIKFAQNRLPKVQFPFEFGRLLVAKYSEKSTRVKSTRYKGSVGRGHLRVNRDDEGTSGADNQEIS